MKSPPESSAELPPEVAVENTEVWMQQLREVGSVEFRLPVVTESNSDKLASVTVETFGRLDNVGEQLVRSDFETQMAMLNRKIQALEQPSTGEPMAELRAALDASQLLLDKARLEIVLDMLTRHDYATIEANSSRPPRVAGFERLVHGPAPGLADEPLDVVFFVSTKNAVMSEALEYRNALYWEYWGKYVMSFNERPHEERVARIERNDKARSLRRKGEFSGEMTADEIEAAIFTGPIAIVRSDSTLALRR